jgi:quinol monooxygenase YgiN
VDHIATVSQDGTASKIWWCTWDEMSLSKTSLLRIIVCTALALVSYLVLSGSSSSIPRLSPEHRSSQFHNSQSEETFTLCVTLIFNDEKSKDSYLKLFSEYAQWVATNELTTLSYQLLQSDASNLEVMVLERYVNKDAYLKIHKTSPQFLNYKKKFIELRGDSNPTFSISGRSYYNSVGGFV